MRHNAQTLVFVACENSDRRGLSERVTKALLAFRLAHDTRRLRCADPVPICVETHRSRRAHDYQLALMSALRDACHWWLHTF